MRKLSEGLKRPKTVVRTLTVRRFRLSRSEPRRGRKVLHVLDAVLRHPATLLLAGFLLTAIVGARIQNRQNDVEKDRLVVAESSAAIARLRGALAQYSIRARLQYYYADVSQGSHGPQPVGLNPEDSLIAADAAMEVEIPTILRAFPRDADLPDLSENLEALPIYLEKQSFSIRGVLFDIGGGKFNRADQMINDAKVCVGDTLFPFQLALESKRDDRNEELYVMQTAVKSKIWPKNPGSVSCPHPVIPVSKRDQEGHR